MLFSTLGVWAARVDTGRGGPATAGDWGWRDGTERVGLRNTGNAGTGRVDSGYAFYGKNEDERRAEPSASSQFNSRGWSDRCQFVNGSHHRATDKLHGIGPRSNNVGI
jgi:hypothetical protein